MFLFIVIYPYSVPIVCRTRHLTQYACALRTEVACDWLELDALLNYVKIVLLTDFNRVCRFSQSVPSL